MAATELYWCGICGKRHVIRGQAMCAYCRGQKGGLVSGQRARLRKASLSAFAGPGVAEAHSPGPDLWVDASPEAY